MVFYQLGNGMDLSEKLGLSKNDYIAQIIENIVTHGYKDANKFVEYVTMILPMMSTEELQAELACLE
jgi:hypothetical protein